MDRAGARDGAVPLGRAAQLRPVPSGTGRVRAGLARCCPPGRTTAHPAGRSAGSPPRSPCSPLRSPSASSSSRSGEPGFRATLRRFGGWWRTSWRTALGAAAVSILVLAGRHRERPRDHRRSRHRPDRAAGRSGAAGDRACADRVAVADGHPRGGRDAAGRDQISAIGDSVTLAAAPELEAQLPGIAIDAMVSRQMSAAPGIVQAELGQRHTAQGPHPGPGHERPDPAVDARAGARTHRPAARSHPGDDAGPARLDGRRQRDPDLLRPVLPQRRARRLARRRAAVSRRAQPRPRSISAARGPGCSPA